MKIMFLRRIHERFHMILKASSFDSVHECCGNGGYMAARRACRDMLAACESPHMADGHLRRDQYSIMRYIVTEKLTCH